MLVMRVGLVGNDVLLIACRVASSAFSWTARSLVRSERQMVSIVLSVSSDERVAEDARTGDAFAIADTAGS